MLRAALRLAAVSLLITVLCGCALFHRGRKPKKEPEGQPTRVGRVALINTDENFVLIETNSSVAPAPGTTLHAYTGTAVSAELRATGVRRRPFLVADLVSGTPVKDDLIVQDAPNPKPAPTPPPAAETPPKRGFWSRTLGHLWPFSSKLKPPAR